MASLVLAIVAYIRCFFVPRHRLALEAAARCDEGKAKRWLAFLNNHREVIAAFDFFTVPTLKFRTLYCFFVIEHGRRHILHFNCPNIRQAIGLSNNYAKLCRCPAHTVMFGSIETLSSAMRLSSS
jgi:hypothetical protein